MSELEDLDFDDVTLGATSSVDDLVDETTTKEETTQETTEPEVKKQRGRPKKDATPAGTEIISKTEEEPEGTQGIEEEEEQTNETDEVEEGFIKSIANKLGIELGEDEEFEDSEDGLIEFTQRAAEEFADAKLNGWLEALPPVASDFFDYLQMLGEDATEDKVKSGIGPLAYRPGWHAGDLPIATHIGKGGKPPVYRPYDHRWSEVEFPDDVDWQSIANERGINKKGKLIAQEAHITDQIPFGGYYRYKTSPNMTGEWLISGDMKLGTHLTDDEVKAINQASGLGVEDLPRFREYLNRNMNNPAELSRVIDSDAGKVTILISTF